jgi:hypothetical protein
MSNDKKMKALEQQVKELAGQLGMLQDQQAIRKLQHAYGYYLDKCLYREVVDLFATNCEVRFMRGVFKGKAGARRLYIERFGKNFTGGKNRPMYGFLLDHPQVQDIITISPDRKTAHGRFRCSMQAGLHHSAVGIGPGLPRQWWEGGIYENQYVRERGVWKIKVLNYRPVFHATFEHGWTFTPPNFVPFFTDADRFPKNPIGPDEIDTTPVLWPDTDVLPFHYPHPVTGKPWPAKLTMTATRKNRR